MSAIENSRTLWSLSNEGVDSKYEKCRNITEEIYKRINITFQIKKLETAAQSDISDQSDQIDSNELSNETDLFACDKSSISSSTDVEPERTAEKVEKYININNNEEHQLKKPVVHKRPKKRFRKRVKKRQPSAARDSDGSSDEALPLSRMVDVDTKADEDADVMGVPNIVIVAKDLKPKEKKEKHSPPIKQKDTPKKTETITITQFTDKRPVVILETIDTSKPIEKTKEAIDKTKGAIEKTKEAIERTKEPIDKSKETVDKSKDGGNTWEWKNCSMCGAAFRGDRGLRRHMAMTHKVY